MRAAFFDLDKTVIAKSSLVAFGPEFNARGLLRRRTLIWGVLSQMLFMRFGADDDKLTQIRESVLKVTKGWDHDEVRLLVAETINDVIEPLIYAEALELIDHNLGEGDEVWLVSMSPSEIVEPFAELLGITGAISSRAKIDENGKSSSPRARTRPSPCESSPPSAASTSSRRSRTRTRKRTSRCSRRWATRSR